MRVPLILILGKYGRVTVSHVCFSPRGNRTLYRIEKRSLTQLNSTHRRLRLRRFSPPPKKLLPAS